MCCGVIFCTVGVAYKWSQLTGVERSLLEQPVVCSLHECSWTFNRQSTKHRKHTRLPVNTATILYIHLQAKYTLYIHCVQEKEATVFYISLINLRRPIFSHVLAQIILILHFTKKTLKTYPNISILLNTAEYWRNCDIGNTVFGRR